MTAPASPTPLTATAERFRGHALAARNHVVDAVAMLEELERAARAWDLVAKGEILGPERLVADDGGVVYRTFNRVSRTTHTASTPVQAVLSAGGLR